MISAAHVHAYRALTLQRRNERGRLKDLAHRASWWLFAAAIVAIAGPRHGHGLVLAVMVAISAHVIWFERFANLHRQNHPNAARLVPGHTRVLRETAVALWLGLSAVAGLGMSLGTVMSPAWMLAAALVMLYGALWTSRPWLAGWLTLAGSLWPSVSARGFYEAMKAAWSGAANPAVTAAGLLLGAWLLCLLLREGSAAHRRAHASGMRLRRASESSATGRSMLRHTGRLGERFILLMEWPQRAWSRHLLARAAPTTRSVLARADLVLGAHWAQQLGGLALFLAIAALSVAVAWFGFGLDLWRYRANGSFGIGIGFTCAALGPVLTLASALHASRREQALLMLLPGMPRGAALNRHLARRHGLRILLAWAASMSLIVLLNWGAPHFKLALAFGAAGLPVTAALALRNWARLSAPSAARQGWSVGVMVLAGLFAGWLARESATLAVALPPALIALGLALLAQRWWRAGRLPQALPAGRLAA